MHLQKWSRYTLLFREDFDKFWMNLTIFKLEWILWGTFALSWPSFIWGSHKNCSSFCLNKCLQSELIQFHCHRPCHPDCFCPYLTFIALTDEIRVCADLWPSLLFIQGQLDEQIFSCNEIFTAEDKLIPCSEAQPFINNESNSPLGPSK